MNMNEICARLRTDHNEGSGSEVAGMNGDK